jgi:GDPmannose 4,6-dehydratase
VGLGTLYLLEAIKDLKLDAKFYQASSSEMFGDSPPPQSEKTPFQPQSPYAAAKVLAHNLVVNYRDAYNIFACSGILFNHESPRRGETFVTRKTTKAVANIIAGNQDKLYLGNMDAKRDWGFAQEYVKAMWLMLQQKKPDDFVIATGETHSVKEFVELAFKLAGLNWKRHVRIDPKYFRPTDVKILKGDCSKAKRILKWKPKVNFEELIKIMLNADLKLTGMDLRIK